MALTYTEVKCTYLNDEVMGMGYLTHDGSSTTVTLPVGTIDFAIVSPASGTGDAITCSWSGNTLTVSGYNDAAETDYIMFMGTA